MEGILQRTVKCERCKRNSIRRKKDIKEHREEIGNDVVKIKEVIEVAQTLKGGKLQNVLIQQPEMLQNIGENGFEMLTELYNTIWEERIPKEKERGNSYTDI